MNRYGFESLEQAAAYKAAFDTVSAAATAREASAHRVPVGFID